MSARDRWHMSRVVQKAKDDAFVKDFNTCVVTLASWITYAMAWLPAHAAQHQVEIIYQRKREGAWRLLSKGYETIYLLDDGRLVRMTEGRQSADRELKLYRIATPSEEGKKGVITAIELKMLCMDIFSNSPFGMFDTPAEKSLRDDWWGSSVADTFAELPLP